MLGFLASKRVAWAREPYETKQLQCYNCSDKISSVSKLCFLPLAVLFLVTVTNAIPVQRFSVCGRSRIVQFSTGLPLALPHGGGCIRESSCVTEHLDMAPRVIEGELGGVGITPLARAVIFAIGRMEKVAFDTKTSHLVQRLEVDFQEGVIISREVQCVVAVVGMRTHRRECKDDVRVEMLLVSVRIGEPIGEYNVERIDTGRRIGYEGQDIICDNVIDQEIMKVIVERGTLWSVGICPTCHPL